MKNCKFFVSVFVGLIAGMVHAATTSTGAERPPTATVLTSAKTSGHTIASPGFTYNVGPASAFDNQTTTRMLIQKQAFSIFYTFDQAKVVNAYGLMAGGQYFEAARGPKSWKLYGSNDCSADASNAGTASWTQVDARTGETAWKSDEYRFFECPNATAYKTYKFEVTANNGNSYTQWKYLEYFNNKTDAIILEISGTPVAFSDVSPAFGAAPMPDGATTFTAPAESLDAAETTRARCMGYKVYTQNAGGEWVEDPNRGGTTTSFIWEVMPAENTRVVWQFEIDYKVTVEDMVGGSVTLSGSETTEGGVWYRSGETLTVTAVPEPGYEFYKWKISESQAQIQGSVLSVSVEGPVVVKAVYRVAGATEDVVYVSEDGNDDASGVSEVSPKRTITAALKYITALEGGTIYVGPGTYPQSKPLSLTVPVSIIATEGDPSRTVISNTVSAGMGVGKSANQSCVFLNHAEARVENFTFANGSQQQQSGKGEQATIATNGGTISNCVFGTASILHPYEVGVFVNSADGLIQNCVFENMVATSGTESSNWGDTHGIALKLVAGRVENCLFKNNNGASGTFDVPRSVVVRVCEDGELVNCTFIGNSAQKGICFADTGSDVINCALYANVCLNAANTNPNRNSFGGSATSYQNCASDMVPDAKDAETKYVPATCIAGLTAADFKDYANGDFRPAATSSLRDAGETVTLSSKLDLLGEARIVGSAIDIGAYEGLPVGTCLILF